MKKIIRRVPESALPAALNRRHFDVVTAQAGTDFVFYDPATGRIEQTASIGPAEEPYMVVPGFHRLQAKADVHSDYVDLSGQEPVIRPRPLVEGLDDLPSPCTVTVRCRATGTERRYVVSDGSFDYQDAAGFYSLTVSAWPYQEANFDLEILP